jgi:hypothetical protein
MVKRLAILALMVLLASGVAGGSAHAAKAKKVSSEVDIDGYYFPPPNFDFAFLGNVYSKKPKCVRNRTVTISFTQKGETSPELLGTTTTDKTGDWTFDVASSPTGDYVAEVAKRRVGKKGKRFVCKADVSPVFAWSS